MYDEALETVNEYEKSNYNSPLVFQMRALIFEKKENYFQEHVNWAKYNLVRGEKEVAINEYLEAYQINNSNIEVVEALAYLHEEIGEKNKASEFFECLLELEPTNKTVLEKLARFRDEIGDYKMAIEYMERLKEVDPRNNYVELNLENFKEKLENDGNILYFFRKLFRF
jgi:tetratricopeptide (TPR) repeat protein